MSRNEPRPPSRGNHQTRRSPGSRPPITSVTTGDLPRWIRDEITRSTSKERREMAIRQLERGVAQFAEERYQAAFDSLTAAKALAPRAATIRELMGLAAYYIERWAPALQELRAFRRLAGETTHMPVEMDVLRALGKGAEVEKTWELFKELGGDRDTEREATVVYASYLLDRGRVAEAWRVIKPGRLVTPSPESEVRRWFVAARVALAAGDKEAASRLINAVAREYPAMAGLDELRAQV